MNDRPSRILVLPDKLAEEIAQMKHTPGPWKTYITEHVIEVQSSDGKPVITWPGFDNSNTPLKVHKANARLIAAAPELLAACQAFVTAYEKSLQLEKVDTALRLARAAIDKAKGQ